MTWSLQRDNNTLTPINSENTCIDCEHRILSFGLDTVQVPGPCSHWESAATLERGQCGIAQPRRRDRSTRH